MTGSGVTPLGRQRHLVLGSLAAVTAASWVMTLRESGMPGGMEAGPAMPAPVFLAEWIVMMTAMMFPAASPVILAFAAVHAERRRRGAAFVSSWVFSAGYLLVWAAFGALAYAVAAPTGAWLDHVAWMRESEGRLAGLLVVAAGLYQLSPLKHACLSSCRSPLAFFAASWREGSSGAVRMGVEHGLTCLGCCWLLFAILFPLGLMNLPAMAALTLLVFAEKSLPAGPALARVAAIVLVCAGAGLLLGVLALPGST